jgi:hypothetical protein
MKLKKVKPGIIVESKSLDGSFEFIGEVMEINSHCIHVNEYYGKEVIQWIITIDQVSMLKKVSKKKLIDAYLSTRVEQTPDACRWQTLAQWGEEINSDSQPMEQETLALKLKTAFTKAELGIIDHGRFGDGSGAWVQVDRNGYSFVISFEDDDETITNIGLYKDTVEVTSSDIVWSVLKGKC